MDEFKEREIRVKKIENAYPLEKVAYSLNIILQRLKQKIELCDFEFSSEAQLAVQKLEEVTDYLYGQMSFIVGCISMAELKEDRTVYKKLFNREACRLRKEIQKLEEIAEYTFMEEEVHSLENTTYYLDTIAEKLEAAAGEDTATAEELSADRKGLFNLNTGDQVKVAIR